MRTYYEILGIEEEASGEEIEARWAQLMKECASDLEARGETDEKIMEIKEAYQVLKNPTTRAEYDLEKLLKRSIRKQIDDRREKRYERKRTLIPTGVIVVFLLVGIFAFMIPRLTIRQKAVTPSLESIHEGKRLTRPSESASKEIPKAPDRKSSKPVTGKVAKPEKTAPSGPRPQKKELELTGPITIKSASKPEMKVETTKPIPREIAKLDVPPTPEPISKDIPKAKVEDAKPVVVEPGPAATYVPVPDKVREPEVSVLTGKEASKDLSREGPKEAPKKEPAKEVWGNEARKEIPIEPPKEETPKAIPKAIPKEVLKDVPREVPKEVAKEVPKEVSGTLREEEVKTIPPRPPAAQPSQPPPFTTEQEVMQFLARYADRYVRRDIKGFLSLFSPMAMQNEKDGIEGIREIYLKQFDLFDRLKYRLKNIKIEILEKSATVKATYEIDESSRKGGFKQLQGNIEYGLVKEGGTLKILTLRYHHDNTE
jgi:curved DNA-binding protein CbpA